MKIGVLTAMTSEFEQLAVLLEGTTECSHAKKNEAKPIFVSYTEINSTWIPDLKLKL